MKLAFEHVGVVATLIAHMIVFRYASAAERLSPPPPPPSLCRCHPRLPRVRPPPSIALDALVPSLAHSDDRIWYVERRHRARSINSERAEDPLTADASTHQLGKHNVADQVIRDACASSCADSLALASRARQASRRHRTNERRHAVQSGVRTGSRLVPVAAAAERVHAYAVAAETFRHAFGSDAVAGVGQRGVTNDAAVVVACSHDAE